MIHRTFRAAGRRHADFLNRFFDDNGWWGLAWIRAYDLTSDVRYLDAAKRIFDNMITAWDDACGGGLWWNEDRQYKNAITNELFLTLAARLHLRSPGGDGHYLDWALREWRWFSASGMIGQHGLVNDGLTSGCENNGKPTYTYNQGVILGGLADLYEITGDSAFLRQGESIADAALRELTTPPSAEQPGILTEPGEARMAGRREDGSQFKGIFVRNLYDFYLHSLAHGIPRLHLPQRAIHLGQQRCSQPVRPVLGRSVRHGRCEQAKLSSRCAQRRCRAEHLNGSAPERSAPERFGEPEARWSYLPRRSRGEPPLPRPWRLRHRLLRRGQRSPQLRSETRPRPPP